MGDADNIIAAIVPDRYYAGTPSEIKKFKQLIKTFGLDAGIKNVKENKKENPALEYKIIYDSTTETLEPIYFWVLDFIGKLFKSITKITDNFASSPGSGHFSELGMKKSEMQKQAMSIMATINSILKSIINIIYDLKEFKVRLKSYENADSKDESIKEAGMLALKQLWMDKVDILRGQGSLNALSSGNLQFVTLRDAFMKVNSAKEVDELDLNDRVIRILKPRIEEFLEWKLRSKQELEKRYEIERAYLKSQVDSLKLQSKWAKPYLKAAQQLESNENFDSNPALVGIFNTVLLELSLMGKNKLDVGEEVISKNLPKEFAKMKNLRPYNSIAIIDFTFRGIPNKAGQHYTFGGLAEVTIKGYALNDDELKLLKKKMEDSDVNDSLKLIQGMTEESLGKLKIDIDEFLGEEEKDEPKKTGFFSEFFGPSKPKEKKAEEENKEKEKIKELEEKGIKHESYAEKYIRNLAEANAMNLCYTVYDIYKKAHGMAVFPYEDAYEGRPPQSDVEKFLGFK